MAERARRASVDPTSPEGQAIYALYRQIQSIEHADGGWNGGDVVSILSAWFDDLGLSGTPARGTASLAITFDPAAARSWLDSPSPEAPDFTVAEELGIDDGFGYDGLDFHSVIDGLVAAASAAGVLGPADTRISLWQIADGDGVVDGMLLTLDIEHRHRNLRLASLHRDFRDLTTDRSATGAEAALCVLRAVQYEATQLFADWAYGMQPALADETEPESPGAGA